MTPNGTRQATIYRGSRKHVLDWTTRDSFLAELTNLLEPVHIQIDGSTTFMPVGYERPAEARLEQDGPYLLPGVHIWGSLASWWLTNKRRANTPNWDIAAGCKIERRPGLVLVEAKANWPELGAGGKPLAETASLGSRQNHERIGIAIDEACSGWRVLNERVCISHKTHYQLANRLAFTWKLAMDGIPVVLLYLGFTGDTGIRDVGPPFVDDNDWRNALTEHIGTVFPASLMERRLVIGETPTWVIARSRPVIQESPPAPLRDANRGAHL